jgi:hypothetical protein
MTIFHKMSPISIVIKTGLSALKLFHEYRQMDEEILTGIPQGCKTNKRRHTIFQPPFQWVLGALSLGGKVAGA